MADVARPPTVEYAIEAIKVRSTSPSSQPQILPRLTLALRTQLGSTTVGIQTSEGVVLAVEKRTQSPLLESDSVEKIMEIDRHIACAMSGLTADARTMVEHARVTAQVRRSLCSLVALETRPRTPRPPGTS